MVAAPQGNGTRAAWSGALFALAATVGWSANPLYSRLLAENVPPFTLCLARCLTALAVFAPFAGKRLLRQWPIVRARLGFYVFLSLTGLGLFNSLVYVAGQTTPAVNLALLNTATPVFILLLARVFLKEALTAGRIVGICVAFTGIAFLATNGQLKMLGALSFAAGDLYMLFAAFLFACYTVAMRRKDPELDNSALVLFTFIASVACLAPIAAWEAVSGREVILSPAVAGGVLYLGVVASILCYLAWGAAIDRIGAGNTSLIYYTLPLFTGIGSIAVLGEPITWVHFTGGGLILAGVITATAGKRS